MAEKHALFTGDTRRFGNRVTLADGTVVDTTAEVVYLDSHDAAVEAAHQIGLGHAKHGHPDDVEHDAETGETVQRAFVYDDTHHKAHTRGKRG